jgi:hypothetical protein
MKYKILVERDGYKTLLEIEIDLVDDEVGVIDKIIHDIFQRFEQNTLPRPLKAKENGDK